jgi:hypothetical protein
LLKERSILTIATVVIIAILQPTLVPHWGLSVGHFWQWGESQDRVLNTTLLLLLFYLGKSRKPIVSEVALELRAFDPRFFLPSLLLFVFYNRLDLKRAQLSFVQLLAALNPSLFLDRIGFGFLRMVVERGAGIPLYYYASILFLTLVSIIVANTKEIYVALEALLSKMSNHSGLTSPHLGAASARDDSHCR